LTYWDQPGPNDTFPLPSGPVIKNSSYLFHYTTDTNLMKANLKTYGPLDVNLNGQGGLDGGNLYSTIDDLKANFHNPPEGSGHLVVIVGFRDDAEVPTGGYWIIRNSWSETVGDKGYFYVPYGGLEVYNQVNAFNSNVYYTGSMVKATWNGGASWTSGGTNWTATERIEKAVTPAAYAWQNQETSAVFDGAGSAITINGTVIAHGMTINAGATGYSFTGGALTVTAGGITANESTAINSPVTIGGPQSWTVAAGKTLTIGNAVHTVISDLTVTGAGNTVITGPLDGGGYINIYGGAKAGNLIKSGAGTLTLGGASVYDGSITQSGAGTLYISPTTGVTATYSGAIGGSGAGQIEKTDAGTAIFSASNSYSAATKITGGALQANVGTGTRGLPYGSYLILNGGVIQSNTTDTFTRSLNGTVGSNRFYWTTLGGGFSAGGGPLTVKINNGTSQILWGNNVGSNIVGTLKFGSDTAGNVVDFQNAIDLGSSTRTIQVDDNPDTGSDYAKITGILSGSAGLIKTGNGVLELTRVNTFSGTTTIAGGALQANDGVGLPGTKFLCLDGGVLQSDGSTAVVFSRSLGTSGNTFQWTSNGGGFAAGSATMTVQVGGGVSTLNWDSSGNNLVGTLKFGSATAANVVDFQNGINLNGVGRTIQVDDNPSSTADYAKISGAIVPGSGTPGITKTGAGLLVLAASNSCGGNTVIAAGALSADEGVGLPSASLLVLDGGVWQNNLTAVSFARSLGTSGGNVQWTLNGGGFAGGTAGPLTVNLSGGATLAWGNGVGNGIMGTLKFGAPTAVNDVTFQNGINLSGGARTIQVDKNTAFLTGIIADGTGGASLAKTGAGTLTLGAVNTFAGNITVNAGTLCGTVANAFGSSSNARTITVNKEATLNFAVADMFGNYATASIPTINVIDGTVTNSGTNVHAELNNLNLSDGTLTATVNHSTLGAWNINGTVTSNGVSAMNFTAGNGQIMLQSGNQTTPLTTFNVQSGTLTVSNPLVNGNNNSGVSRDTGLTKTGTGTMILAGTNAYTGKTTLSGGILIDEGAGLPSNSVLVFDGGVFQPDDSTSFTRSIGTAAGNVNWTANGGGFAAGTAGPLTVNLGGSATPTTVNWISTGTNGIRGTLKFGAATSVSGITFQNGINLGTSARTIQVDDTVVHMTGVLSGSSSGSLVKNGSGTLIFDNSNSFSGNLTVNAGIVYGNAGNAFGSSSSSRTITVNADATLIFSAGDMFGGHTNTSVPTVDIEGGTVIAAGGHQELRNLTINNGILTAQSDAGTPGIDNGWASWNFNGTITSHGISRMDQQRDSAATISLLCGDYSNPATTFSVPDGTLTVSIPVYDGIDGHTTSDNWLLHATGLTKTGAGTLMLAAANQYSGVTTINGGTISVGILAANGSNSGIGSGSSVALNAGTLQYTGGANDTFNRSISLGTSGGTIDQSGSSSLVSLGVISGNGSLTKTGSGQLILKGANTYTGATDIKAGTLSFAANTLNTTSAIKMDGGVLQWNGHHADVSGKVTMLNGQTAIFDTADNNVTFSSAIGSNSSASLMKIGEGSLTLSVQSTYTGDTIVNEGTLKVLNINTPNSDVSVAADAVLNASSIVADSLTIGGGPFSMAPVDAIPVPEPGMMTLLILAGMAFTILRFRRR
jgi:autotransporter-associated beta strand protein